MKKAAKILQKVVTALVTALLFCAFGSVAAFAADAGGGPDGGGPGGGGPGGGGPGGGGPGGGGPGGGGPGGGGPGGGGSSSAMNASTFFTIGTAVVVVVGIIAIIALILAIRSYQKKANPKKPGMKKGPFTAILAVVMVILLVATPVANYMAMVPYRNSVNTLFTSNTKSADVADTSAADWQQLCYNIAAEGMVLLRNENNTLPLNTSGGLKVNLLGYRAYDPVYSGSGSGSTSSEGAVDFQKTLTDAGFVVNTACVDENVYAKESSGNEGGGGMGFMSASFSIDEVSLDRYTGSASFESMKAFSDIAIVVIGRTGGEGSDLTNFDSKEPGKTYLQLSAEEEALLQQARDTFGTLIVIYNGANTMEMGYLETYNVDAAVWAGIPGAKALAALGPILSGEVNPSGKLPDTWAYDLNSAAASENFGEQEAANAAGEYYVDYVENIYVGYKWYETAYAEGAVITNTKTGVTYDFSDYDSIVQFPFGYGLSYTTFTHEIVGGTADGATVTPDGTVEVSVKVTNTGSTAGKNTVELYLTAPYTDYDKQNGVEKSAVSLIAFGKTGILEPGQSETVELSFPVEDMASYDMSHDNGDGTTGCYMLDAGDYILSARSDSHNVYDEVTVKVSGQHFYTGGDKRASDDQSASNQMDFAARGAYLSRQNGFANYAQAMNSVSASVESNSFSLAPNDYDDALDAAVTGTYKSGVDYDVRGTLTLADMKDRDYDDPMWEEFVRQLSIDDIVNLITNSMFGTPQVASIGKSKTSESDGPQGISSMFSTEVNTGYPCIPLLSATFNSDIAYTYGQYIADEAHTSGITGWYAPGMNTHRWAFSGRNFEYYSEDGALAGGMAANEVAGARDNGLIVYLKHFAFNDQETHRAGMLHTYTNEQAAREIYLKPFEDSIKKGGATAIMNSMNYIGDKWIGVSGEIQQEIVRGEWNFRGRILTDMSEGSYMTDSGAAAVRNGTDMWLSFGGNVALSTTSDADIYYLQRTAKNILYAEANAMTFEAEILNWQMLVYLLDVEVVVILAACALAIVSKHKKDAQLRRGA